MNLRLSDSLPAEKPAESLLTKNLDFITHSEMRSPELGLVCLTASEAVRFKTLTRKRLLQFSPEEQINQLRSLYRENLNRLEKAIQFCEQEQIKLYRLVSKLFPFVDEPIGAAVLEEFVEQLRQVGEHASSAGIRLVSHPDQFVVLNSDRPEVIETSIKVLGAYAHTMDCLGLPQSPWSLMNIHGGKGDRAERLIETICNLPDPIRQRLTLENDEYAYSAQEILEICQATKIPMVFDAHHHIIHEGLESYDDPSVGAMVEAARETWAVPEWQLVHISNGANTLRDIRHSGFIYDMPSSYAGVPWIEIEAKQKEFAIARLRQEWPPVMKNYAERTISPDNAF